MKLLRENIGFIVSICTLAIMFWTPIYNDVSTMKDDLSEINKIVPVNSREIENIKISLDKLNGQVAELHTKVDLLLKTQKVKYALSKDWRSD